MRIYFKVIVPFSDYCIGNEPERYELSATFSDKREAVKCAVACDEIKHDIDDARDAPVLDLYFQAGFEGTIVGEPVLYEVSEDQIPFK